MHWANLPLELIRQILVDLALSGPQYARTLRLVSSDVNVLVLPLLFRDISICTTRDVSRLTTILLPKRKHNIPALKSRLHIIPRPLSTYTVGSCVLVINDRRPSIEEALAKIAPVFCGISNLAITARNLQAHGYWLRKHPVRPRTMMIVHYGSPCLVNYHDPIFENVRYLYTSVTHGHRASCVADLPSLTHLAVSTRRDLPEATARNVAASLHAILAQCQTLQRLVLVLDYGSLLSSGPIISEWESRVESCLSDRRFILLPDFRPPRLEWEDLVAHDPQKGAHHESLWQRAERWKKRYSQATTTTTQCHAFERQKLWFAFLSDTQLRTAAAGGAGSTQYRELEWEIDLVERDDYQHPKASDPDLKGVTGFQSAFDG
jgi:hypothetical protein